MHGEYKVPGGKLVVANVEVEGQHLTDVSISGDFFLEPDSALKQINQALNGMPVNSNASQIVQTIQNALGDDVVMYGFSAQAIAIALRRALGKASGWYDHVFDVIPAQSLPAAQHVALELEVLRIGREKLSDKGITSANKRVDPMRSQTGMERDAIIQSFINHFQQRYSSQLSQYRDQELVDAKALVDSKFMSSEWVTKVP